MDPLPAQLAARDRLMRAASRAMTPDERLARMRQLQEWSFALLASNPEAFERFWRRNLRKRAVPRKPLDG